MKTAEDCLDKHGVRIFGAQKKRILEAMEEYASQFKTVEPKTEMHTVSVDESLRRNEYKDGCFVNNIEFDKSNSQDNNHHFSCYEIWRPNIPDDGCKSQCKECKEKQRLTTL